MSTTIDKSFLSLKRHIAEYLPQIERAIAAIHTLNTATPESEEFSQALADLHVAATILEPYSEGIVEAIDRFTEDRPDE
jgi:hypothetical protein